ncbi:MAG: outer membrane beta-barrel protein [Bacteroidaceae bacterium]|nr:outer membrane beta-barrel protein [Bacteroidaceae bacterium]
MIKKFLSVLTLTLCFVLVAKAQEDNSRKNKVIVYAGPQLSTANCGGGVALSGKFSYLAGVQYEHDLSDMWGFYAGAEYTSKGINGLEFMDGHEDDYTLNYVQCNLGVKFEKEIFGIDGLAEVGPYVAYGIGGNSTQGSTGYEGNSFGEFGENFGFKKFDAGINVGVGADFGGLRIMVGYQHGLMNIADEDLISNGYKNYGFYAKIGYGFKF